MRYLTCISCNHRWRYYLTNHRYHTTFRLLGLRFIITSYRRIPEL